MQSDLTKISFWFRKRKLLLFFSTSGGWWIRWRSRWHSETGRWIQSNLHFCQQKNCSRTSGNIKSQWKPSHTLLFCRYVKLIWRNFLFDTGNGNYFFCFAGFDNIPLEACKSAGIRVGRVPSYSPSSIAEYAVSSIMVPIIYFFDGRSPSRHKQIFFI